jgi:hypothetical protein
MLLVVNYDMYSSQTVSDLVDKVLYIFIFYLLELMI